MQIQYQSEVVLGYTSTAINTASQNALKIGRANSTLRLKAEAELRCGLLQSWPFEDTTESLQCFPCTSKSLLPSSFSILSLRSLRYTRLKVRATTTTTYTRWQWCYVLTLRAVKPSTLSQCVYCSILLLTALLCTRTHNHPSKKLDMLLSSFMQHTGLKEWVKSLQKHIESNQLLEMVWF